ncbi:glycosyltransferase family 1 protein [Lusitaniella coriacea]|uniref:glycosyltransferase family 1 protein n=1 Tax=Lusitaniella coriacea TaxID=1983105 RepID=UPI001D14856F|nr:glycosyltransferase family 1 protein [Lusitaniella coriacea]
MSIRLVQIVPTLPPEIDGLGDYALNLARQLRRDWEIETHFIVGNPNWVGEGEIEGFSCHCVVRRSPQGLLSQLPGDLPIFLHYSSYGYAKRGCPSWLVAGLERCEQPLIVMFHEVYTYDVGSPWTSSFWLSPWQKNLAKRLAHRSDRALTSKQSYAKLIQDLSGHRHKTIPVYPVFSNIGEPSSLLPLEARERHLILFGHRNTRSRVYQNYRPHLAQTCEGLDIERIYDIGVPTGLQLDSLNGTEILEMGVLPAEKISELMSRAIAGFLCFPPPEYLAKSGIFAAYCAHGLIPILTTGSPVPIDGLETGKHYGLADDKMEKLSLDVGRAIAKRARSWYQNHSLSVQANAIAEYLK